MPPELSLAWQVERWGAGAVLPGQISARLLKRMTACSNVFAALMSYQSGKYRLVEWATANPLYAKIVAEIRMMREQSA